MKRDLLSISGAFLAIGLATWALWGNPVAAPQVRTFQSLHYDPDVRLVTERGPYMRTER